MSGAGPGCSRTWPAAPGRACAARPSRRGTCGAVVLWFRCHGSPPVRIRDVEEAAVGRGAPEDHQPLLLGDVDDVAGQERP